jgi:hypothetical protein
MPTARDWFLIALLIAGVLLILGNFLLGLFKGKVLAPPGIIEMAATRKVRSLFLTRAEAPLRFWHMMIFNGAMLAVVIFFAALYVLHPEVFRW